MKILKRDEFKKLLESNPGQKFIFFEYEPDCFNSQIHITMGDSERPTFGAWAPSPCNTGYTSNDWGDYYDWNLNEYYEDDQFAVLEEYESKYLEEMIADAKGNGPIKGPIDLIRRFRIHFRPYLYLEEK